MTSVRYIHLRPGSSVPQLDDAKPFKTILVVEDDVSADWRDAIADWLVTTKCRYLMAWGVECEAWHDCVDWANLEAFDFAEMPDGDFIMTTWHTKDQLRDVFLFSEHWAMHPTLELDTTYILHIAENERSAGLLKDFGDALGR
ncbi:MAG TPA: hypothetical protein VGU69_06960 [Rhizomicrobium sp.]|nr:hypothetical protein [Rhizomicrobium sp.]